METRRSPSIDAHGGGPTDYPLIDADPHFGRVVRYFRPSDYGVIVASTAAIPAGFIVWSEHMRITQELVLISSGRRPYRPWSDWKEAKCRSWTCCYRWALWRLPARLPKLVEWVMTVVSLQRALTILYVVSRTLLGMVRECS